MLAASAVLLSSCAPSTNAVSTAPNSDVVQQQDVEELNPFDPNIQEKLESMDRQYFDQTGFDPLEETRRMFPMADCKRITCKVFALIKKSEQKLL